jgi:hypothetical protein
MTVKGPGPVTFQGTDEEQRGADDIGRERAPHQVWEPLQPVQGSQRLGFAILWAGHTGAADPTGPGLSCSSRRQRSMNTGPFRWPS